MCSLIGIGDRRAARHLHHLINAAARRIHFDVQLAIGGAGVQAQPAVHALVEIGLARGASDTAIEASPVEQTLGIEHVLHSFHHRKIAVP